MDRLSPDLPQDKFRDYSSLQRERQKPSVPNEGILISKGFRSSSLLIGMTPTILLPASQAQRVIVQNNEAISNSYINKLVVENFSAPAMGWTIDNPISVKDFSYAHFFLSAFGITGNNWCFYLISPDLAGNWVDIQRIFHIVDSGLFSGNFYCYNKDMGIPDTIAFRWEHLALGSAIPGGASINFTLSYTLKGSTSRVLKPIFLGSNQNVNQTSGYPLYESQKEYFVLEEGAELWGISEQAAGISISIFHL